MKQNRILPLIVLVALCLLTACGAMSSQALVSIALDLDVSDGEEIASYDTHSGNGDGTTYIALQFDDDTVLEELRRQSQWNALPLDETVRALVYGVSDDQGCVGPFLHDGDGNPLVPEIQNGYYRLIDRHSEGDGADNINILNRNSFNFTLGLYDADHNILYLCKLDT